MNNDKLACQYAYDFFRRHPELEVPEDAWITLAEDSQPELKEEWFSEHLFDVTAIGGALRGLRRLAKSTNYLQEFPNAKT